MLCFIVQRGSSKFLRKPGYMFWTDCECGGRKLYILEKNRNNIFEAGPLFFSVHTQVSSRKLVCSNHGHQCLKCALLTVPVLTFPNEKSKAVRIRVSFPLSKVFYSHTHIQRRGGKHRIVLHSWSVSPNPNFNSSSHTHRCENGEDSNSQSPRVCLADLFYQAANEVSSH